MVFRFQVPNIRSPPTFPSCPVERLRIEAGIPAALDLGTPDGSVSLPGGRVAETAARVRQPARRRSSDAAFMASQMARSRGERRARPAGSSDRPLEEPSRDEIDIDESPCSDAAPSRPGSALGAGKRARRRRAPCRKTRGRGISGSRPALEAMRPTARPPGRMRPSERPAGRSVAWSSPRGTTPSSARQRPSTGSRPALSLKAEQDEPQRARRKTERGGDVMRSLGFPCRSCLSPLSSLFLGALCGSSRSGFLFGRGHEDALTAIIQGGDEGNRARVVEPGVPEGARSCPPPWPRRAGRREAWITLSRTGSGPVKIPGPRWPDVPRKAARGRCR